MYRWVVSTILLLASCSTSMADVLSKSDARVISQSGTAAFLVAGIALPLVEDGKLGKNHFFRAADAFLASTAIEFGLKQLIAERRPDGSDRQSFPSGHAMESFTIATIQSQFHPKQAPLWFAGATLISGARLQLNKHRLHDVIAGAVFGYGVARLELSSRHGLILAPLITDDGRVAGISLMRSF